MTWTREKIEAELAVCRGATAGGWSVSMFRRPGYMGEIRSAKPWDKLGCDKLFNFERAGDAEFTCHARGNPAETDGYPGALKALDRVESVAVVLEEEADTWHSRGKAAPAKSSSKADYLTRAHYLRLGADWIRRALEDDAADGEKEQR